MVALGGGEEGGVEVLAELGGGEEGGVEVLVELGGDSQRLLKPRSWPATVVAVSVRHRFDRYYVLLERSCDYKVAARAIGFTCHGGKLQCQV